jgi:hypothetical protein
MIQLIPHEPDRQLESAILSASAVDVEVPHLLKALHFSWNLTE